MADKHLKWEDNIQGPFYVDQHCIACDACIREAPHFFSMNEEKAHAFVKLQPRTDSEKEECINALDLCPVEAIGNDGVEQKEQTE